mmetsp:Transcript_40967/g.60280  ORF Transcript_40967/g.60280 Transcript_40967/m.60280 type:complete len:205 (-) Transcript_40967:786-1400(-)
MSIRWFNCDHVSDIANLVAPIISRLLVRSALDLVTSRNECSASLVSRTRWSIIPPFLLSTCSSGASYSSMSTAAFFLPSVFLLTASKRSLNIPYGMPSATSTSRRLALSRTNLRRYSWKIFLPSMGFSPSVADVSERSKVITGTSPSCQSISSCTARPRKRCSFRSSRHCIVESSSDLPWRRGRTRRYFFDFSLISAAYRDLST